MKYFRLVFRICASAFVFPALLVVGQEPTRERFIISAKAGGINVVAGSVMVKRDGQESQLLTSNDNLVSNDVVTTARGGRIEILLNPGSYVRLAENSEFVLVDNSLDNLLIRLNRGSAIIEATGARGIDLRIPVVTDQQRVTIRQGGIYRFDVSAGVTKVLIRKGRVELGEDPSKVVKSGHKLIFTGVTTDTAKLAGDEKDEFDEWSKTRGETLARANGRLSTRSINEFRSLASLNEPSSLGQRGLWAWSPFANCYTFLPFYDGWTSPYGGYYSLLGNYPFFFPVTSRPQQPGQPVGVPRLPPQPVSGSPGSNGSNRPPSPSSPPRNSDSDRAGVKSRPKNP
jgi:hypothetical protein